MTDPLTRLSAKPVTLWALLLPEAGFRSQVLGLAERLGATLIEKNVDLRKPWSILPARLCPFPLLGLDPKLDRLEPPWPDVVIACGRRTIPLALAIKRASGGRTLAVYIQNPKGAMPSFDLVVSMRHDGLEGPNVMVVDTAIHRVTPEKLAAARDEWRERFTTLPHPLVGVILGGKNRSFRFTEAVADRMIAQLIALSTTDGAGFIITPSRLTEPEIFEKFKRFAAEHPAIVRFWDGHGDNPYFGLLALSDALIVTEDSVSMVSEALASGKPVATVQLEGKAKRHQTFIENLIDKQAISRFDGTLPQVNAVPAADQTEQAAEMIRAMLAVRLTS